MAVGAAAAPAGARPAAGDKWPVNGQTCGSGCWIAGYITRRQQCAVQDEPLHTFLSAAECILLLGYISVSSTRPEIRHIPPATAKLLK